MKTIALILLMTFCGTSYAEISKITINKAWKRITKAGDFPRIAIIFEKDKKPNAWVKYSEGHFTVHITKGLMRLLDTEDEIAGVLGHELGHIRLGHHDSGSLTATMTPSGINSDIYAMESVSYTDELSARQEKEADDYGVELLRKARYNPRGLYDALSKIDVKGYVRMHNGFMSEPVSRERLAHVAEKAGISRCIDGDSLIGMDDVAEIMTGK